MKNAIQSKGAPAAIGTYSQAVRAGDTLYLSGQIGLDPETMQMAEGIEAARQKGDRQAEKEMTVFARRLEKKPR